jgi:hypothetical protein
MVGLADGLMENEEDWVRAKVGGRGGVMEWVSGVEGGRLGRTGKESCISIVLRSSSHWTSTSRRGFLQLDVYGLKRC